MGLSRFKLMNILDEILSLTFAGEWRWHLTALAWTATGEANDDDAIVLCIFKVFKINGMMSWFGDALKLDFSIWIEATIFCRIMLHFYIIFLWYKLQYTQKRAHTPSADWTRAKNDRIDLSRRCRAISGRTQQDSTCVSCSTCKGRYWVGKILFLS